MSHILLGAGHVPLRQGPLFSSILGQSSGFKLVVPLLPHAILIWPLACSQICIVNHNLGQLPHDKLVWGFPFISQEGFPPLSGLAIPFPGFPTFRLSQGNTQGLFNKQLRALAWSSLCKCC